MSILDKVSKGKVKKPFFGVIFGPPGIGKSTFASRAPGVLFAGAEEGTFNMDVARLPKITQFQELMDTISALRMEKHEYQTLALDTLDSIEPILWDAVCKMDGSKSIDEAQGSYGKGYTMANVFWGELIKSLHALRDERGMNIIAIAHSQIKTFNDPSLVQPYDRYQLKLNEKAAALWRETCDILGFCNFETFLKTDRNQKKNRALGEGKRILYTERRPSFDAKNRLGLPFEMPLDYGEFEKAISHSVPTPVTAESLLSDIRELSEKVSDEKTRSLVNESVEKAGLDINKLSAFRKRLKELTT